MMTIDYVGIKTLDPSDWSYRGIYDNSNDSTDLTVAHGFNYHQGPEWVWIYGMYLRAYLLFHKSSKDANMYKSAVFAVQRALIQHKLYIQQDPFSGLPELTNMGGSACYFSCPTQAWSTAVFLELIFDIATS